ncbi:ABC-F family ATP-binding cassette domain-containing protein [Lachnospiraceae bacterium LCP25S3_G4]
MNLLTISQMTKSYTDKMLFDQADFSIAQGEKVGVIGINGTGKSTLLKIIAGMDFIDAGEVVKGNKVIVRYLPQNPEFPEGIKIYDYVITKNVTKENEWMIEGEAKAILTKLGFHDYNQRISCLSGGEKKRVALAAALLTTCDILILDEPTNHLDSDMAEWLEEYLNLRKGALIMVTHDRYFLDQVCNRIVEIDKGHIYNYEGNYEKFLELKAQREEMQWSSERKRQSILRVELEWMKRGARARSTKQKARIERYEELKGQNEPLVDDQVIIGSLGQRLGKKTIELKDIVKRFDDKLLIENFSYIFLKNERIGIIGKNGCGKSTLMKIITGVVLPDSGNVEMGSTVKIGYFSQENEYMDSSQKVIDYIKETAEYIKTEDGSISAAKMLERFLFDSTLQYQRIEKLSGGERRRLYLLKILMDAPNVLILDEPTNDLDITTLSILEQYLDRFEGIVITVSHDRYFLDRVVNRIFAFEDQGIITQYEGNFTDYQNASNYKQNHNNDAKKGTKKSDGYLAWEEQKLKRTKVKFTFKEQKEYESIDNEIATLEDRIEQLDGEAVKVSSDFIKLNDIMSEKSQLELRLEEKMERWVYLQDLAEKMNI